MVSAKENTQGTADRDTAIPTLRVPNLNVAHCGTVRLGSGTITANFPPLRLPNPDHADRGRVRLGSGTITAKFPIYR